MLFGESKYGVKTEVEGDQGEAGKPGAQWEKNPDGLGRLHLAEKKKTVHIACAAPISKSPRHSRPMTEGGVSNCFETRDNPKKKSETCLELGEQEGLSLDVDLGKGGRGITAGRPARKGWSTPGPTCERRGGRYARYQSISFGHILDHFPWEKGGPTGRPSAICPKKISQRRGRDMATILEGGKKCALFFRVKGGGKFEASRTKKKRGRGGGGEGQELTRQKSLKGEKKKRKS